MNRCSAKLLLAALWLLSFELGLAKGITVQLSISGPGFDVPIHTSDPQAISASVWGGRFVDWHAEATEWTIDSESMHLVYFWVVLPRGGLEMKYAVWYTWDNHNQRPIVCLPGKGEYLYFVNSYSIYREGKNGKCFYGEKEWGSAVYQILQERETQS